jgi:metallo-beta-lactamase family protein
VKLTFLGAVTGVTGSQFLLETERARVLVDCGLFQGSPHETMHNRAGFAFDPRSLDAVLLTHAHLDHSGMLPLLSKSGYRGPILGTAGTVELATLVLRDSGKLQQEAAADARRARRRASEAVAAGADPEELEGPAAGAAGAPSARGPSAGAPSAGGRFDGADPEETIRSGAAEITVAPEDPLYVKADVEAMLPQFRVLEYGTRRPVAPGVTATLVDAGHILGSAIVTLDVDGADGRPARKIVFSGDLGRPGTPIVRDPTRLSAADYVLCESTYGGLEHPPTEQAVAMLADVVREVGDHDGVLLVPAFAIGRTQELVWELDQLLRDGKIPALPLFLDSPMATKATDIYRGHPTYFDDETRELLQRGDEPLDYPNSTITRKGEESRAIESSPRPFMIISSNGMLTGGRILNHLKSVIDDPSATLLFVGYQAQGTLGAHLQAGAGTCRIDGAERQVRCRIRSISGFSAHSDEPELVDWLGAFSTGRRPRRTFLVHGDPEPRHALADAVGKQLGYPIELPGWRETVELD